MHAIIRRDPCQQCDGASFRPIRFVGVCVDKRRGEQCQVAEKNVLLSFSYSPPSLIKHTGFYEIGGVQHGQENHERHQTHHIFV